jgi:AcrR family transcriptional regulator
MAPKRDVSDDRRSQILDAATKVFARRGFKDARMDDIVQESGLSKGLLYWYFKSKDAIVAAFLERLFSGEFSAVKRLRDAPGSARERIMDFSVESARQVRRMGRLVPVTFEFYSLAFRNKAVRGFATKFFQTYVDAVTAVVAEGVSSGEFRDIDPRQAALTVCAVVEGAILLWVFDPDAVDVTSQIESAAETLLRGMEAGARRVPGTPTAGAAEARAKRGGGAHKKNVSGGQ